MDRNAPVKANGFALPAAVFALVIVGVLVTGGFFLANQEYRIGVASENASEAVYVAEQGLHDVLLGWSTAGYADLSTGDTQTATGTTDSGSWTAEVLKTSDQTYLLTSSGEVTEGGAMLSGASREVGMFLRVILPDIEPPAAIATQGEMTVAGSTEIQGHDTDPSEWGGSCSGTAEDKPGIKIDEADNVDTNGSAWDIDGDPAIEEDPNVNEESLLDFGDTSWDDLVSMADKIYSSSQTVTNTAPDSVDTGSGFACDPIQNNWGDPKNPGATCYSYFPMIYAAQNLKMNSSSSGQGILLVEGDLEITGGFEFYGIVIVKGTFSTSGTGGHVNGGVIAANASLESTKVTGNAVVTNSTCAAERAIRNNSAMTRPKPLASRGWMDMTALSY